MSEKVVNEAAELSAAAYIALGIAIHGGDPNGWERIAKEMIYVLAAQVGGTVGEKIQTELSKDGINISDQSVSEVKDGLERVGMKLAEPPAGTRPSVPYITRCFIVNKRLHCVNVPPLSPLRP